MKSRLNRKMGFAQLIGMFLVIFLLINVHTFSSAYSLTEEKTLSDVERDLNEYIAEAYPQMVIGSAEYIDYLSDQMLCGADLMLTSREDYDDIELYASSFLTACDGEVGVNIEVLNDGTEVARLFETEKSKTLSQVREENDLRMQQEEQLALFYSAANDMPALTAAYSPSAAATYAQRYAENYNVPTYKGFLSDCTNFVSQCVVAGGKAMSFPSDWRTIANTNDNASYWYHKNYSVKYDYTYKYSKTFINVASFYSYALKLGATATTYTGVAGIQNNAKKGDIVQCYNSSNGWHHSIIITSGSKGNWKYCGHSSDRKDYPVANLTKDTKFRIIRL